MSFSLVSQRTNVRKQLSIRDILNLFGNVVDDEIAIAGDVFNISSFEEQGGGISRASITTGNTALVTLSGSGTDQDPIKATLTAEALKCENHTLTIGEDTVNLAEVIQGIVDQLGNSGGINYQQIDVNQIPYDGSNTLKGIIDYLVQAAGSGYVEQGRVVVGKTGNSAGGADLFFHDDSRAITTIGTNNASNAPAGALQKSLMVGSDNRLGANAKGVRCFWSQSPAERHEQFRSRKRGGNGAVR